MQRSGDSRSIAPWAVRSSTRFEAGGYIGGGSLHGNSILMKGSTTATGPMGAMFSVMGVILFIGFVIATSIRDVRNVEDLPV